MRRRRKGGREVGRSAQAGVQIEERLEGMRALEDEENGEGVTERWKRTSKGNEGRKS